MFKFLLLKNNVGKYTGFLLRQDTPNNWLHWFPRKSAPRKDSTLSTQCSSYLLDDQTPQEAKNYRASTLNL
jgi:hypothetical protein